MTIELLIAPAAAGKTAYLLTRVLDASGGLQVTPRVIVPTRLQVRAWRRRLAGAGGALGVRVLTFDHLYTECLNAAGEVYTELSEPVQYRLIRAVVDGLSLDNYAPLARRPGFIQVLEHLIGELKAARVDPEAFAGAVEALGSEPRLGELARIYASYQDRLQAQGWADRAGLGWLAVEALEERAPGVARDWPLLAVDGFDDLTEVQLALLKVLAGRVGEMVVTLTGTADGSQRPLAHRRFDRTRRDLEAALGVEAEPLPEQASCHAPALVHLEAGLFRRDAAQIEAGAAVELVEAPNRAAEVRAALRWLKARLVEDGLRPGDVALLARSIASYRPFILQTAAEFGLPVRLLDGLPLRTNPVIAALLDLMRLVLPAATDRAPAGAADPAPGGGQPRPSLPRRLMVEAWRSPYFDWAALPAQDAAEAIGIGPGDADTLDAVARFGRVVGGWSQWTEVLDHLAGRADPAAQDERGADEPRPALGDEDGEELPMGVPVGAAASALRAKFHRFMQRLTPPQGLRSYRDFAGWLEALIGPDPEIQSSPFPLPDEPTALEVVSRAQDAPEAIAGRDVAALRVLKDILRGLVWAEEALEAGPGLDKDPGRDKDPGPDKDPGVDYAGFYDELVGVIEAAAYQLPICPDREEIVVADVVQARGVPFRAVAVLGLAEGEFPATISEDPFLRDVDRERLRDRFDLPLDPSLESAEAEFFYETVTRPRECLLLTRPRLADNGTLWQASPFWEEVRRLVDVQPESLTSESLPAPARVASWPELLESLAAHRGYAPLRHWVARTESERQQALEAAVRILDLRRHSTGASAFDGDLGDQAGEFAARFGPAHLWSSSRLETYRACPFFFFVRRVLGLEPRQEPAEGLDAAQLGTIYHHIFEGVYLDPAVSDPADLEQLLAALPHVAGAVLDAAPEVQGFRETAWWAQTRQEILDNVRGSLEALADMPGEFVPHQHEAVFGLYGKPALEICDGDDRLRLCGFIDRVDRAPDGRLRVIDYKTAGPSSFGKTAVVKGKKLQLPLYVLAARDALGLGEPAEGFYWHVRHAKPSGFVMSRFDGGPQGAIDVAVEKAWEAVRGVRDGHFVPQPPGGGCPSYCPAAGFCWHYQPGFGG